MNLKEITKNIYISPYDEKNGTATIGYINGSKFSIMVDFGNSKDIIDTFEKNIIEKHLKQPKLTVLTHSNIDHIEYISSLKSKTVSCLNTHNKIKKLLKSKDCSNINKNFCSNVSFSGKILLKLGNLTCAVVELPSPYCDDCVAVFVKEEKTLFLADGFNKNFYLNKRFNIEKAKKLKKILTILDFNKCILGHCSNILTKNEIIDFINEEINKNIKKMA